MNYNTLTTKLQTLNTLKNGLIMALGNVGIYLPKNSNLRTILFCVYFYYMYNLFSNNNQEWKDKYLPLDGRSLVNFIEGNLDNVAMDNIKYRDIANEILPIIYNDIQNGNVSTTLNKGQLELFSDFTKTITNFKDEVKKIAKVSSFDENTILPNTRIMMNNLINLWYWKKHVLDSAKRKNKVTGTISLTDESVLSDISTELFREPSFTVPDLKIPDVNLKSTDLNRNDNINYISNPYTVYGSGKDGQSDVLRYSSEKDTILPTKWNFMSNFAIDNIRPNTKINIYSGINTTGLNDPSDPYSMFNLVNTKYKDSWNTNRTESLKDVSISIGNGLIVNYKDNITGEFFNKRFSANATSYLGWRPEIFLYSKHIGPLANTNPSREGSRTPILPQKLSAIDDMNAVKTDGRGTLGMTIIVPEVVEYHMRNKNKRIDNAMIPDLFSSDWYNSNTVEINTLNRFRDVETVFLVGIYPVDKNDRIMYEDPIVFQYFSGAQLDKDLGKSFANYRMIKNPANNPFERSYYPLRLGQLFYRNQYSFNSVEQISVWGRSESSRNFENAPIGYESRKMLYLYGRDTYLPYVGKSPIPAGQNYDITNPNDNTNIMNIQLPENTEYKFSKYGTAKIAVQLYMNLNDENNMNRLEDFEKFFDNSNRIPTMGNTLLGNFAGLPYYQDYISGTNKIKVKGYDGEFRPKVVVPEVKFDRLGRGNDMSYEQLFSTKPIIIDADKSDEHNAPWLFKKFSPYVDKIVISDTFKVYPEYNTKASSKEKNKYVVLGKGLYIRMPNDLDLAIDNDKEAIEKLNNKKDPLYGYINRDRYIRAIKNALIGVKVNYKPDTSTRRTGTPNASWFSTQAYESIMVTDEERLKIIYISGEAYLYVNCSHLLDLNYAGLGKFGTIKVQLVFRNEFFRSDDPDSPLNYNNVPITGDVTLLREIAGQKIKLYRGGILTHPTEYNSLKDRISYRDLFEGYRMVFDLSRSSEALAKRQYTRGYPKFADDGNNTTLLSEGNNVPAFEDNNSVYDIISIEMDANHWKELIVDPNADGVSSISSVETPATKNRLQLPINLMDTPTLYYLEYKKSDIDKISINGDLPISPIITMDPIVNTNIDNNKYIDIFRFINFWQFFRPKVKFGPNGGSFSLTIEEYDIWKARIIKENSNFFNKNKIKFNNDISDGFSVPYNVSQESPVDLVDLLNISANITSRSFSEYRFNNKEENSKSLYNIFKAIILDHKILVDQTSNEGLLTNTATFGQTGSRSINSYFGIPSKFGGYFLDRILLLDWVFTHRFGDNIEFDDKLRLAANDTALDLVANYYRDMYDIKRASRQGNQTMYNGNELRIVTILKNFFNNLFMNTNGNNNREDIFSNPVADTNNVPHKRLLDFKNYITDTLVTNYNDNVAIPLNNNSQNVVPDNKLYKGDNRIFKKSANNVGLRRGYRMGENTPDNPLMGFSMPATTVPENVPDHIHLVYCDIYWKDFDKSVVNNEIPNAEVIRTFTVENDKDTISYRAEGFNLVYDFKYLWDKYNLKSWKGKKKHVIFRLMTDKPTKERHRDCPEYVTGIYYDNKFGKGFSPDLSVNKNEMQYIYAVAAFVRWLNEHKDVFENVAYTLELPLGINMNGLWVNSNNEIKNMENLKSIYDIISQMIYGWNYTELLLNPPDRVTIRTVIPSALKFNYGEALIGNQGWSFNRLGSDREDFYNWLKYDLLGLDNTMINSTEYIKTLTPDNTWGDYIITKFRGTHVGYSGNLRDDITMEELTKPDNFRELLYQVKTINPMYVIGYIDKDKYPEQYQLLLNEMGYKYTITSSVIEDDSLKVFLSNESKISLEALSLRMLNLRLLYKDGSAINEGELTIKSINRNDSFMNSISNQFPIYKLSQVYVNQGDSFYYTENNTNANRSITRLGVPDTDSSTLQTSYAPQLMRDIYAQFSITGQYIDGEVPIKLANINRDTKINLTDSGLLKMFIEHYTKFGSPERWFRPMYWYNLKVDDNGWV